MGENPSCFKGRPDNPVENVSWDDCRTFLEKLNALPEVVESGTRFRFPTEEEWDFACRAKSRGLYSRLSDGTEIAENSLDDVAWFQNNAANMTHPVGQKKPNAFGLYDMCGNVWEWTSAGSMSERVYCGGSWKCIAACCGPLGTNQCSTLVRDDDLGFRLCATGSAVRKAKIQADEKAEAEDSLHVVELICGCLSDLSKKPEDQVFVNRTKAKARRVRRFFRQGKWADVIDLTDSIVEKTAVQLRREMVDPGTSGPGPKRAPVVLSDNAKAFERGGRAGIWDAVRFHGRAGNRGLETAIWKTKRKERRNAPARGRGLRCGRRRWGKGRARRPDRPGGRCWPICGSCG